MKIATPLACEVNELNIHLPSHSSLTIVSVVLLSRVSFIKIKSGFLSIRKRRIFCLFGFLPMELALKEIILNLVADGALPLPTSGVEKSF